MIRINLLPEEYRKKSRTPLKLLFALAGLVAVNAVLASWWGWTVFGVRAKVESERATLQLEMDGLAPQVAYYHALEGESKQYKSREKTLASITADRISWTRKMDELIDVANAGGDGSRHLVWLDDLNVTQSTDSNQKNFGSVRAAGHSGSEKFAQVANFLEDLEISAFIDDFEKPSPPEGTQTLVDETLVPPVAWAFPMSLSLKSPEERAKSEAARLKKGLKDIEPEGAPAGSSKDGAAPSPDTKPDKKAAAPAGPETPPAKKAAAPAGAETPPAKAPEPKPPESKPKTEGGSAGEPGSKQSEATKPGMEERR
jgi:Tfp pilus assembly protein PilN